MSTKAQATLEVAVLIIIVAVAFAGMYGYLRRAIQADWRNKADSFSDGQYDPKKSSVGFGAGTIRISTETMRADFLKSGGAGNINMYSESTGLNIIGISNWGGAVEMSRTRTGTGGQGSYQAPEYDSSVGYEYDRGRDF